ncbi:response regulator transcription factor [Rhodobacteraceae bacterium 2376]|uniref:Response regulator transcription factor n=1 Tax=Rhabdonatronobacter sediminivivens TaxID=2743469 RepID=A0A7Z0KXJ5_9RHOB|nr:response regulator transcription factor [Rhabdonatronobacter sediminivivens]NYS24499.1 response regulator transcription factor [Rhabdonatronobacter sediminivivens]
MQGPSISATDLSRRGGRAVVWGMIAIVVILLVAAVLLFYNLPDAGAFNARVERIFVEQDLTTQAEIKLLEILALSGTAFAETLASYRVVIFVLMVFATALLITSLVLVATLIVLNRRMAQVEKAGIQVSSLVISRATNTVAINDMEFRLTQAAIETLAVLAEARMDGDILSGAAIEAMISGRDSAECDEASGATRIKRLRDTLGNQLVSEVLIRNITRQGYVLAIDRDVIRMI